MSTSSEKENKKVNPEGVKKDNKVTEGTDTSIRNQNSDNDKDSEEVNKAKQTAESDSQD